MRRTLPDISYKKQTREIIESNFKPWQLSRKDEREGFHRLVNEVVSHVQELSSEVSYVENMFFLDSIDVNEDWVMFTTYPNYKLSELYFSGEPVTETCTEVTTTDDFIGNGFDVSYPVKSISFSGEPISINLTNQRIEVLSSRKIHTIDIVTSEIISTSSADVILSGEMEVVVGELNRQIPIEERIRPETLIITVDGTTVPYTIKNASEFTSPWNPDFDVDNNGIVGSYEEFIARSNIGSIATDFTPSEWEKIGWLDIDEDGVISEKDVSRVLLYTNSISPGVYHVVNVSGTRTGVMALSYEKYNPNALMFSKGDCPDHVIDDENLISDLYKSVTYVNEISVYFGVETDGRTLRAFKYDFDNSQITADMMIHIPDLTASGEILDVASANGFVYALIKEPSGHRIAYDNVLKESIEYLSGSADIVMSGEPTLIGASPNGSIILYADNTINFVSAERDRCMEVDGESFFNIRKTLTLEDGTAVKIVPSYIFNSFDAFAYSFGIERPYGMNNLLFKDIISDFWIHQQSNSEYGMNYGILREVGIIPDDLSYCGDLYILPETIIQSGNLWYVNVNGCEMNMISESSGIVVFSGIPGEMQVYSGHIATFSEEILKDYDTLEISSYFSDGNGDPIYLTYNVKVKRGKSIPDIHVYSYDNAGFLESEGFIVSGEPTEEFIAFVNEIDSEDPFTYANAVVDVTPMDMKRTCPEYIIPTVYDPKMAQILSGMPVVNITL